MHNPIVAKGYRDPLHLTAKQRRDGMQGVAHARAALREAKKNAPIAWRALIESDVPTNDDSSRHSER